MYSPCARTTGSRRLARDRHRLLRLLGLALLLVVSLSAAALAASTTLTLGSAANPTLAKQIVVSPQGRTLYTLSPETRGHLLCKSSECLRRWPPVTARSGKTKLKAPSGVQGHLGLLKRANGSFQVTLRGLPLYRYAGDRAKGEANGEGIESFGGTWHVASASSATGTVTPSAPTTPNPPTTTPTPPPMTPSPPPTTPSAPPTTPSYPYPY
jgi:predicted lipoprotein with Yx(FWY)xxD motif